MANWYNCPTPIEARIARVSALYQARLARVSLMAHPGFQYKVNQEGYSNYTFGGRVGTSFEFSALCHDLAHAVEFGPDLFTERCSPSSGFVLHVREFEIMGNLYDEPQTGQASARECRAFGLDTRMTDLYGVSFELGMLWGALSVLCGFFPYWFPYPNK